MVSLERELPIHSMSLIALSCAVSGVIARVRLIHSIDVSPYTIDLAGSDIQAHNDETPCGCSEAWKGSANSK